MKLELTGPWTVRARRGPVPDPLAGHQIAAEVPGSVHLDLLRAGLIPDPYLDENEQALSWIGHVDWCYTTAIEWTPTEDEVAELVFAGLDTVATIRLNGAEVAHTRNMHRTHRVDVTTLLRRGSNDLEIEFRAGHEAAYEAEQAIGHRPYVSQHPFNALRKMACNYGWDWGPVLITCGLWQPAWIETWNVARLAGVRPLVSVDGATGRLDTHVDLQRHGGDPLTVAVTVDGVRRESPVTGASVSVVCEVPDVELWWPTGYGEQPLYDVTVELRHKATVIDRWTGRVGFRTVDLDLGPDRTGAPFTFRINGRPLFAKGFNWIPEDCFPSRVDAETYRARLTQARDANANMIRVWGGGRYESEDFYSACDELGLLVWQDFLFACAAYTEAESLRSEVEAEARENITRLSSHPSLVLWNGCNENLWGFEDWGWKQELNGADWGLGYYTDLLPRLVAELDPTRPYTPGSPFSPGDDKHPDDPAHGTMHIWDVWNQKDYGVYADYRPRFVSEFGFQGPPTWATLTRAVHDDPLTADSPGMLNHQKAEDGQGKLMRGLSGHLPTPSTVEDWHFATSVNQAHAVSFGVEHFRSLWPYCAGALVWQLNDCWPVISWAAVDGDGRRKPLWYALRKSFADRLVAVRAAPAGVGVVLVNDSDEDWADDLVLTRADFAGRTLAEEKRAVVVPARKTLAVDLPESLARPGDPARELLRARLGEQSTEHLFVSDAEAALPAPGLEVAAEPVEGGYVVTVTARTVVRDLCLLVDRLATDAEVDEQLVTLLPGETRRFRVSTAATVPAAAWNDPLVVRSVNQLLQAAD